MGFLKERHTIAVKAKRALGWTREFIIESRGAVDADADYYESAYAAATQQTVYGDWAYRDELEQRGSAGGPVVDADILLTTDIDYYAAIAAPGARLIVDGVRYNVRKASSYPETGECVVAGERIA